MYNTAKVGIFFLLYTGLDVIFLLHVCYFVVFNKFLWESETQ